MSPSYKIAVIQLKIKVSLDCRTTWELASALKIFKTNSLTLITSYQPLKPADNFKRAADFVRDAASQGCHLAVLPEFHLTNWLPTDPRFESACADWEDYLKRYQALAKECDICIVPGSIVQPVSRSQSATDAEAKPGLENVTYFISNTGEILGSYVKKNLWVPSERPYLRSSGNSPHQVIQTPLGPVGLLVCWDMGFPEAFRELVYQGAKIIIIPGFFTWNVASKAGREQNPSAALAFIDSILTARAFENTCAVVFADAGGPEKHYCGLSQITVPFSGPIMRLSTSTEGMGIGTLDMDVLEAAEQNYLVRADLTDPNWHYRHTLRNVEAPRGRL